jgi:hypothetical protein
MRTLRVFGQYDLQMWDWSSGQLSTVYHAPLQCRQRLGGLLRYYFREAA